METARGRKGQGGRRAREVTSCWLATWGRPAWIHRQKEALSLLILSFPCKCCGGLM